MRQSEINYWAPTGGQRDVLNFKTRMSQVPDGALLNMTQKLASDEREFLSQILHHLREIERRRLYCTLSCGSLFQYATKILGYSEDQAYRRIQAMKLLKEIPEIEEKLLIGVLNLTHFAYG